MTSVHPNPAPGAEPARGPRLHLPAGTAADGPYATAVDPAGAGWDRSSLRILELPPGGAHAFDTGDSEWIVLPLSGGCSVVTEADTATDADTVTDAATVADADGHSGNGTGEGSGTGTGAGEGSGAGAGTGAAFELHGRASVFDGVTDFAYVPRDAHVRLTSAAGGRFALTGARCENRLPARYGPAAEVAVELRGSGSCSRQVNNFAAAGAFDCDKLIAVEVLTPGGNWSSYPPHKHDEDRPGTESELEEIYYFEIAAAHGTEGLGYQRVSPSGPGKDSDVLAEVRSGDTILIPDGWHGPSMAAPGHDMYYLNVMAGPGAERAWLICDHPDHAWIRTTWPGQPVDPRLPLYEPPAPTPAPAPAGAANPEGDRA
ncbi:5-deoxy-glucuronate isomerase [Streptomyces lycii]|uniref:5-deoxy-glucuronate isomerase n=1 Tax=Streptomyces lycii TaxID=2654337 RepID=A0ABQ7FMN0_9ACTN|nr:5-deoxy-glucuronate isomerase [Streptomyces lycii]KAF4408859.1 5-deoxy-glucuronate isomerase [Streptomyces lycii]